MKLHQHQLDAIDRGSEILDEFGMVYLGMEVRTGKTLTALSIVQNGRYDSCLFVTKKKAIQSIKDDFEKLPEFTGEANGFCLEVINYESLHKVTMKEPEIVVLDEAHGLGGFPKPGKRAKQVKKIVGNKPVIYLSGTPTPESYSQLYHQMWVSDNSPWSHFKNFYRWADQYVNKYQRVINGHNLNFYDKAKKQKVMADVQHLFVSVSQKDAGFKSQVTEHVLKVAMGEHTKELLREMSKRRIIRHQGEVATASGGADLINKLSQISSGTLIFDNHDNGKVIDVSKAHFVRERFACQKIAIIYRYRAEREILEAFFPNWTDVPEDFNEDDSKTFLAQVQSAREGVNLSTADAIVMYNIDFSATSYFQARARMQSRKRTRPCPLYWIFSEGGIEGDVYEAVQKKKNFTYSYYQKKQSHRKEMRNKINQVNFLEQLGFKDIAV